MLTTPTDFTGSVLGVHYSLWIIILRTLEKN